MYVLGLSDKDISPTECFVAYRTLVFCRGWSVDVLHMSACADPESFVRGGPTLTTFCLSFFFFFFFDEGRIQVSGPSSARQRNAI